MFSKYMLVFLLFNVIFTLCSSVTVKTQLGKIKGAERKSRDGKTYYAFTGIPYAKPPVGKLRLKNPVRADAWKDVLDATKEPEQCLQIPMYEHRRRNITEGDENCLHLSVYTPDLKPAEKLAVLFQTHGGGFRCGNPGPKDNPDYLMDGNVILVNVYYRLGSLGFLSTEDTVIPGNFGLKDQAMALHWIKDHIKAFGGDDEKITVFGNSAGGASSHYHMISPMSKGILKGAISQSGSVNQFWSYAPPGKSLLLAKRVAEIVGCNGKTGEKLLDCLQGVDAIKLINAERDFLYWDYEPAVVFRPVKEPKISGAFITVDPTKEVTTLPWMTGMASNEGLFKTVSLTTQEDSVTQEFIDNIDDYITRQMSLDKSCPKTQPTVEKIKEKYFPSPVTIESALKGIDKLFTEVYFTYPMGTAMSRHRGPLYQYLYGYQGGSSLVNVHGITEELGVCHGDELFLLFNFKEIFPRIKSSDEQVSRTLVRLWTNFAKYQKPTLDEDEIKWPKYDTTGSYLHITDKLSIGRHLNADVIDWWFNLPAFSNVDNVKTEL